MSSGESKKMEGKNLREVVWEMEESCLEFVSQDFHGFTQRAQDTKGGFLSQDNKQAF